MKLPDCIFPRTQQSGTRTRNRLIFEYEYRFAEYEHEPQFIGKGLRSLNQPLNEDDMPIQLISSKCGGW